MIEVSIPVRSHVKKYLEKRYGAVHTVSKKSFIGILVLELLHKKVAKIDKSINTKSFYSFMIPEYYFNTKGFQLNPVKAKFLGNCLEKLFFEDFYSFVDTELLKGGLKAIQAVRLFLNLYEITEEEAKLESMYRNYQRHCNDKIKEKKKLIAN